jgi:glycosyltransferase involved in cell wall biosynthesis
MSKQRVLYLRTDIGVQELKAGGSVAHTLGIIQGFIDLGYDVVAASSAMISTLPLSLHHIVPLRMPTWLNCLGFKIVCMISNIIFFMQMRSTITTYQPLIVYQRYSLLNIVGVVLSKRYHIPLVLEFNGSEVWMDQHWSATRRYFRLRWLISWTENYNLMHATTIVVVSQVLKEQLCTQGIATDKIVVHPNGVNPQLFDAEKLADIRNNVRTSLHLEDSLVIGFIGTFSYWHGINVLAEIIPAAIKTWPHVQFLLIGDGPLRYSLQQAVQQESLGAQRVHFLGTIAQEEARGYLAACDIFIAPTQPNPDGTRFFGSPTKLFEYMSLGKPIIASDIEQVAQVLSPAVRIPNSDMNFSPDALGILVAPDNMEGFVDAIALVATLRPEQRLAMGTQARTKILAHYTWQHHVKAVIKQVPTLRQ